jgi:hypothetical protein
MRKKCGRNLVKVKRIQNQAHEHKRTHLFFIGLEIRRKEGSSRNPFLLKISSLKGIFFKL